MLASPLLPAGDLYGLPLLIDAAGETDRGKRRGHNEDTVLVRADLNLFVVADGAGGHQAGDVASAVAVTTVAKAFDQSEAEYRNAPEVDAFGIWTASRRLSTAIHSANTAVIEIARSSNRYRGMGTTIVCALLAPDKGRLHVAHVGDSRCYRLRDGFLEMLTHDHSMLMDVVALQPDLDEESLKRLPRKAVTRALGMEMRLRVSTRTFQVAPGDRYLLCSDGLSNELRENALGELLGADASAGDIVRDLIRSAKDAGGRDNIAALVVLCSGQGGEAPRVQLKPAAPISQPPPRSGPPPLPARLSPRSRRKVPGSADGRVPEPLHHDPEIVLIRGAASLDPEEDRESDPRISVVPADSADESMIRALGRVADRQGAPVVCRGCRKIFEPEGLFCPYCGTSHIDPLPKRPT